MEDMDREVTGRTILFIATIAFGIVFSANMTLAWFATGTFPGLEVKNSYIASQEFNARRDAQEALGWETRTHYAEGALSIGLVQADGTNATAETVEIRVGRPTHAAEDRHFGYEWLMTDAVLPVTLDTGQWRIDVKAKAEDGTLYVTCQTLYVRG